MRGRPAVSAIGILIGVFLFSSCFSPLKATLEQVVREYSKPTTEISHQSGEGISDVTAIVITFSETMDISTLSLDGNLVDKSDGGVWSDGEEGPDSVLTISPKTTWLTGSNKTMTVNCKDTNGYEMKTISVTYGVLDGIVYVKANGSDGNPGTDDKPKATIPAAIELADTYYTMAEVRVAEGTYNVNYSQNTHVVLKRGISVYGGYSADDWSVRDPAIYETRIEDDSVINAPDPTPEEARSRAVTCEADITTTTVFDGLSVEAGGGTVSIGFDCSDSSPTISNCDLNGGQGDYTAALRIRNGSPHVQSCTVDGGTGLSALAVFTSNSQAAIENCTINGGDGNSSVGILNYESSPEISGNDINGGYAGVTAIGIENYASAPVITGNMISGGFAYRTATGVHNEDNSPAVIRNNMIYGGDVAPTTASDYTTFGIFTVDSEAIIQNNTICAGNSGPDLNSWSFGIQMIRSAVIIENNVVFAYQGNFQFGIAEYADGSNPASLRSNDVYGFVTAAYFYVTTWPNGYLYPDFTVINNFSWAEGNLTDNPVLSNVGGVLGIENLTDNDWSLSAVSPTSVTTGGVDLSDDFASDFNGISRTAPWSIGAFEYD